MWSSRLLLVVMLLALGPVGCGFQPMYGRANGNPSAVDSRLASVRIAGIEDRIGQQMRNALVQRITPAGEPSGADYTLVVRISERVAGMGHQKDANATLGQLQLDANFTLSDKQGHNVMTGRTRSIVSFNLLGPRYASIATERDSEDRAISEVADDIRRQLSVYFAKSAGARQ